MSNLLAALGVTVQTAGAFSDKWLPTKGIKLISTSPINDEKIGEISVATDIEYEEVIRVSQETFLKWRLVPAPKRGEVVRQIGEALRSKKDQLGALITWEMGKITAEGQGEVQEAIDIAEFAVGLSRQLYGLSMHSERPGHRMYEQWHPMGPVGVITAFNFPMAVWAWNAMLAAICGDTVIWKPSEHTPFCAIALHQICAEVASKNGFPGLFSLLIDSKGEMGKKLAADKRIPIISATGSCRMGRALGQVVADRFGRSILELGGNNAVLVMRDADLNILIPSLLFGSVGTAGQRCTTTRRILVESEIESELTKKLIHAYAQVSIGDPRLIGTLMGPLINKQAVETYCATIEQIKSHGAKILCGGKFKSGMASANYVEPTLVLADKSLPLLKEEVFAPITYIVPIKGGIDEVIQINNDVPQGLSSSIFTRDVQKAERFLSAAGSDCGIANVNIGTSGAEIGGAFGGEKETGGGRESGSDSWRQYMRRQTCTINYSDSLPLAQGIKFNIG
ncbi:MAG: aldehyde dehydrogenase family protein [bacterium]|nr:aldehyde dehydrogenase family protein [bacterium]